MSKFQVAVVTRPGDWKPACADDVPPSPGELREALGENEDLFAAVREAVAFNEAAERKGDDRWAVVVERGSRGRQWAAARLCSPIVYKVTAIWRPEGWEPESPLDVPNCIWKSHNRLAAEPLCYAQAVETMRALNQQNMDVAGDMWYVLMAVENEPISQTISYDCTGSETTVEVRRLHVLRPERGGRGNCSYCPAHSFQCASSEWSSLPLTSTDKQTRSAVPQ